MAAGVSVLEIASVRAAGGKYQLHTVVLQNVRGPFFYTQAKEKFHFLVTDFYDIRLAQSPEKLLLCVFHATPQGLAEVGVIGNQFALGLGIGHRLIGRGAGRLVRQAQSAEAEHLCFGTQAQIQILKPKLGVRAGFPGEGELPVPCAVQRHKGQGGKNPVIRENAAGFDSRTVQGGVAVSIHALAGKTNEQFA